MTHPSIALAVGLASLAVRPELILGGSAISFGWGWQQSAIAVALCGNVVVWGLRRFPNWLLLMPMATAATASLFGEPHPAVTVGIAVQAVLMFSLPFAIPNVRLDPKARPGLALVIMALPLGSALAAIAIDRLGIYPALHFYMLGTGRFRLEGATGNAAVFGCLAFVAVAVSMHEFATRGRRLAGSLLALNLAAVILSGTRMAILATFLLILLYLGMSRPFRTHLRRNAVGLGFAGAGLVLVVLAYLPTLYWRMFGSSGDAVEPSVVAGIRLNLSVRDEIWVFFLGEFWQSPLFGRGQGAGFVAARDHFEVALPTPHNEYLHLLVNAGVVGFLLFAAAGVAWYRNIHHRLESNDRNLLLALVPALAVYAVTDNILTYTSMLVLSVYVAVMLSRQRQTAAVPGRPAPRRLMRLWRIPAGAASHSGTRTRRSG